MATTSSFPNVSKAVSLVAFTPEVSQGTKNVKFEAATGTGTTVTVSTSGSGRDDAALASAPDDLFNGCQLYVEDGAAAGDLHAITDFAESGGTATFTLGSSLSSAMSSGDVIWVLAPLPASNFTIAPTTENLERDFHRLGLDKASPVKGINLNNGSTDVEVMGLVQELGNGDTYTLDRYSQLMACFGSQDSYAGTLISGGSSTTTQWNVADASGFSVNDIVMCKGQARRVTALNPSATPPNIVVTPAASQTPEDGDEVFGFEVTTPDDTGHRSVTMLFLQDDQLIEAAGCVLNIGMSATFGEIAQFAVDWDGETWLVTDQVDLDGTHLAKNPIGVTVASAYFGTVELCLNSFSFDLGHGRQEIRDACSNGVRYFVRERASTLQVVFRDKDSVPLETWQKTGTKARLLLQIGNAAGAVVVIEGWATVGDPIGMADVGSTQYWDATFQFFDDQTSTTPTTARIARG